MTFEQANSLVMDDDEKWHEEGLKLFGLKDVRSICKFCDHRYDCFVKSDTTEQCNFFQVTNK